MSSYTPNILEWVCTLLSIYGSWLCIMKRLSGFVVFLAADFGWFVSAWISSQPALLAQQLIYVVLNIVGYAMWRRDERLRWAPVPFQANRDLDPFPHNRHPHLQLHRAG